MSCTTPNNAPLRYPSPPKLISRFGVDYLADSAALFASSATMVSVVFPIVVVAVNVGAHLQE